MLLYWPETNGMFYPTQPEEVLAHRRLGAARASKPDDSQKAIGQWPQPL